jgi:hypothetical protein
MGDQPRMDADARGWRKRRKIARCVLACGGKRSATPQLSQAGAAGTQVPLTKVLSVLVRGWDNKSATAASL